MNFKNKLNIPRTSENQQDWIKEDNGQVSSKFFNKTEKLKTLTDQLKKR